jgi:hypothetical protein
MVVMHAFTHAECGQCGWLGKMSEMKEHPTRPRPTDLGFCPECGAEIYVLLTTGQARKIEESYS